RARSAPAPVGPGAAGADAAGGAALERTAPELRRAPAPLAHRSLLRAGPGAAALSRSPGLRRAAQASGSQSGHADRMAGRGSRLAVDDRASRPVAARGVGDAGGG